MEEKKEELLDNDMIIEVDERNIPTAPEVPTESAKDDEVLDIEEEVNKNAYDGILRSSLEETESDFTDESIVVLRAGVSSDELESILKDIIEKYGEAEWNRQLKKIGSRANVIALERVERSTEADRALESIASVVDAGKTLDVFYVDKNNKRILGSSGLRKAKLAEPKVLKGRDAAIAFRQYSRPEGGMRRVPLYNSGFSVDLIVPTGVECDTFINNAKLNISNYGRIFGGYYYAFAGMFLKQAMADFVFNQVINSSLRNYTDKDHFFKHVKLSDFDNLVMSLARLMYPNGFDRFGHACKNCDHVSIEKIDLGAMIRHNYSIMNNEAIDLMRNILSLQSELDAEVFNKYHKELNATRDIRIGIYEFTLHDPSLKDYFSNANRFFDELYLANFGDDISLANQYAAVRLYRTYAPFIKSIRCYDSENPDSTVQLIVEDPETISSVLDDIQTQDRELFHFKLQKSIETFINETKITHIAYPGFNCPKCGTFQGSKSGFITVDPIQSFFTMSVQKSR